MDLSQKKILISVPCRDSIAVGFIEALLQLIKPCECCYRFIPGGLVFDARDEASQIAINNGYDYCLFIDSDMLFEPDALVRILQHDDDVITGLYYKRKGSHEPVLYRHIARRVDFNGTMLAEAVADVETDIDRDYFQVEGCGFGFCLVKTEMLKKVRDRFVSCFEPVPGLGEDLSFCWRVKELGGKIMCDSTIWLGHMGSYVFDRKDWQIEEVRNNAQ